jgi:hypothetical protein
VNVVSNNSTKWLVFELLKPPTTIANLARRTRAGLGRCQGFYCHSELRKLLEKR